MKKILGLDLGTNSIGWALIEQDFDNKEGQICDLGSRIVPMDGAEMSNFKKGLPQTKNAQRGLKKGARVGNKRYKLRRNKLVYVLQKLDLLPEQVRLSEPFVNPLKIQKVNVLPIKAGTKQYTGKEFMKLRAQAIHESVSAREFGKILYRFNQLRGYAGGDDEEIQDELNDVLGIKSDKTYPAQESKVQSFKMVNYQVSDEPLKKNRKVYELTASDVENNEWLGTTLIENITLGDVLELKQTIRRNTKTGEITSVEFSVPKKTGWRKRMENLEEALNEHGKEHGRKTYLSEYFLECLNESQWLKIRDNVILRSRYEEEFDAIWNQQFGKHLNNISPKTIEEIAYFLFPGTKQSQKKLREAAIEKGLKHIIKDQIIYYQRPLKDQSHLISDCRFEPGEKAVANSHPLFQEYKIWEQLNKLSVNRRTQVGVKKNGKPKYKYQEKSVSTKFKESLFDQLQDKKELTFKSVFLSLKKTEDFKEGEDFFNGMSSKSKLVGDSTRITLKKQLGRFWDFLNLENIANRIELWKLLYEGKGNEYDLESERNQAIAKYLKVKGVSEEAFEKIVIAFSCIKFPRIYQSVSLKVVEKALPLMRTGKYFDNMKFPNEINNKVLRLLNEHSDDPYDKSLEDYLEANESHILTSGGFVNAYALILLYGQHTTKEIGEDERLNDYTEIKVLERHSLRNPLVEQMINETLMVVKDLWKTYDRPDEIRVELSRDLKNSKKERERIQDSNEKGRKQNQRIRKRLIELGQELSQGNLEKYKLWEEQKHTDPYTGLNIQLSDLFDKGLYDVDHIIPQSRYFDDSLGNKLLCARSANKDKGNRTPMEYFDAGSVKCSLISKEVFMDNAVSKFFGKKRKHMLATKIPDNPVERQKKETQYITVRVREELSKVVGSRNVKTSSGGVTHYLRNHWGVTKSFKKLIKDRFVTFYTLKAEKEFEDLKNKGNSEWEFLQGVAETNLPKKMASEFFKEHFETDITSSKEAFVDLYRKLHIFHKGNNLIIKGYSKRYDHRHHAMDALVVACTNEKAVKRLNDLNKELVDWVKGKVNKGELDLDPNSESILDDFLGQESDIRDKALTQIEKFRNIEMPWNGFPEDAGKALSQVLVSHKPKDRLLIQQKEERDPSGKLKKKKEKIIRIRGALHEETIYGLSSEKESLRVPLSKFANNQFDTSGNIEKIVSEFLKNIVRDHFVNTHNSNKVEAFGAEGLLGLNKRLAEKRVVSEGKEVLRPHPPISSVKVFRKKLQDNGKYQISLQKLSRDKSFNDRLYVNTGSNYLFSIMEKKGKRVYDIISLFDAVDLLKTNFNMTLYKNQFDKNQIFKEYFEEKNGAKFLFNLKQLDLVYLPDESEDVILDRNSPLFAQYWSHIERRGKLYVVTKFSGKEIYFNHHTIAEVIEKKTELGSQNMIQTLNGRKIAEFCFPVNIDRLGNILSLIDTTGNLIRIKQS